MSRTAGGDKLFDLADKEAFGKIMRRLERFAVGRLYRDDRWCGYAEAVAGSRRARRGVAPGDRAAAGFTGRQAGQGPHERGGVVSLLVVRRRERGGG